MSDKPKTSPADPKNVSIEVRKDHSAEALLELNARAEAVLAQAPPPSPPPAAAPKKD